MSEIPEGTQFIESGCCENKGFRKYEKGCWWFFDGFWRRVDWKMGDLTLVTERPGYVAPDATWSGEGLPPVGTVCEFRWSSRRSADWHRLLEDGMHVEIIAHYEPCCDGDKVAVFAFGAVEGGRDVEQAAATCFYPIRPAEPIAADERNTQILGLADELAGYSDRETSNKHKRLAEYLHDNGCRKQEPTQ